MLGSLVGAQKPIYYRWTDANGLPTSPIKPKNAWQPAINFRRPTVIPIADNNGRRGDRLRPSSLDTPKNSVQDKAQKPAPKANGPRLPSKKSVRIYAGPHSQYRKRLRAVAIPASRGNRLRRL